MEQSHFISYINKYFPALVLRVVETLNGELDKEKASSYLFKQLLTPKYSVDGRWTSIIGKHGVVKADYVAMDSPLPLKRRDALEKAIGEIPKIGMAMGLNERQMTDIMNMIALGLPEQEIVSQILADVPRVIKGVYDLNEETFLQGLSTGVSLVAPGEGADNVGIGIRADWQFMDENKFGVSALDFSKIIDDALRVKEKARHDGNGLQYAYMNEATFVKMITSQQFKEYFAFGKNFVGSNIARPTYEQANEVFSNQLGATIRLVDRKMVSERDGARLENIPWKDGMITFTSDLIVGELVWSRLVEQSFPVAGVSYQTADGYIMVSKFHSNVPAWSEHTTSQARAIPVISNVDRIYQLDTKTLQA